MKGYAGTHHDSAARESFRGYKNSTFDRLINILTILMCLVSIFVCYFIAKAAEEKYSNSIISLQSRLSALELQLQLRPNIWNNKNKREVRSSPGTHEDNVKIRLLANPREKRGTKKKKSAEQSPKRNGKRKKPGMLAMQIEGRGGIQSGKNARFTGTFSKWKYADFISSLVSKRKDKKLFEKRFKLDPKTGKMIVKRKGVYLLFAQITLMGNGNVGYLVKEESRDDPILTCWSNLDTSNSMNYSSCTTVGLVSLRKDSVVYIKHADERNGKALFNSNASFFGLVHISD